MTAYLVLGHPLNYADLVDNAADLDIVRGQLATKGVGQTANMTVSSGSDTKVKGHKSGQ